MSNSKGGKEADKTPDGQGFFGSLRDDAAGGVIGEGDEGGSGDPCQQKADDDLEGGCGVRIHGCLFSFSSCLVPREPDNGTRSSATRTGR